MRKGSRMRMRFLIVLVLLGALWPDASRAQQQNPGSPQVYVVPFSHLDLY